MKVNKHQLTKRIDICSVCGKILDEPVIIYPKLPLTETYSMQYDKTFIKGIDQYFHICKTCTHSQIANCVDPLFLYGNSYKFRTSESNSSKKRIDVFVDFLNSIIGNSKYRTIIDIGCNDTYLLKSVGAKADMFYGIDPILKEKEKNSTNKLIYIGKLIENTNLGEICAPSENLVVSTHTLEHVVNPKQFLEKILSEMPSDTLYVFEFPCFMPLLKRNRFDQIFHQHMQYFTPQSFEYLINKCGCEIIKSAENCHAWGALLVAFRKKSNKLQRKLSQTIDINKHIRTVKIKYMEFRDSMSRTRDFLLAENDTICGYGASLTLPVVYYHLGIDADVVNMIIDDDSNKKGLTYANLPVKIQLPRDIGSFMNKTILITAFDNIRPILSKLNAMEPKHIIVPINIF